MLTTIPSQNFQLRNDTTSIAATSACHSGRRHILLACAHKAAKRHDTSALSACQRAEPTQYRRSMTRCLSAGRTQTDKLMTEDQGRMTAAAWSAVRRPPSNMVGLLS